jgi:hypothetical protein
MTSTISQTTTTTSGRITALLLLLAVASCCCEAYSLRAARDHDETKPRKELKEPQAVIPLDELVQHPRDLAIERRNLGEVQNRVVGGDTVTDYDKHPFFAEWNGQYCGGAVSNSVGNDELLFA